MPLPLFGATRDSSKPLSAGHLGHYNTRFIRTHGGAGGRLLIPGSSLGRIRQPPLADVAAAPAEAIPAPCFRAQHAAGHGIAAARP